ncbi:MAG TPA: 2-oxo acid dehydrogenase subunit E2 [Sedimentisphaerales bacterium]|nr:2-oxo acid dehydrogenase subunit E2 [Sedimentisphaerales bacterium]
MSKGKETHAVCASQDAGAVAAGPQGSGLLAPMGRIQKIICRRMTWSKQHIPSFYLRLAADIGDLLDMRRGAGVKGKVKVTTNDLILKAMGHAVARYPLMAGHRDGDEIVIPSIISVGFAVAAPHGLVVPVIRDIENKSLMEVAAESERLVSKARSNRLVADDVGGACITLSNLGAFGIDAFIAVVPPRHASVLAVGNTIKVPVDVNGSIVVRRKMELTLSVDHAIINGDYAARFLGLVREMLEEPRRLV